MGWRGNCHGNAVAESFFCQLLKCGCIRKRIYATRNDARADVLNHMELFCTPTRRHGTAGNIAPVELERRHIQRPKGV